MSAAAERRRFARAVVKRYARHVETGWRVVEAAACVYCSEPFQCVDHAPALTTVPGGLAAVAVGRCLYTHPLPPAAPDGGALLPACARCNAALGAHPAACVGKRRHALAAQGVPVVWPNDNVCLCGCGPRRKGMSPERLGELAAEPVKPPEARRRRREGSSVPSGGHARKAQGRVA